MNDATGGSESFVLINSSRPVLFARVDKSLKTIFAKASCKIGPFSTLVANFAPGFVTPCMPSDFVSGTSDCTDRRRIDIEVPRLNEIGRRNVVFCENGQELRDDFFDGKMIAYRDVCRSEIPVKVCSFAHIVDCEDECSTGAVWPFGRGRLRCRVRHCV